MVGSWDDLLAGMMAVKLVVVRVDRLDMMVELSAGQLVGALVGESVVLMVLRSVGMMVAD